MCYEDKIVKIKGKVTQFSSSIIGRNWINLQDGTNYLGDFDLVATSNMDVEEGEIVIPEGKITLKGTSINSFASRFSRFFIDDLDFCRTIGIIQ